MAGGEFSLILGTPLNARPKPWELIEFRGVMVNAFDIKSVGAHRFRGRGLRKYLGIDDDVELWIDSGGYQFLRRGIYIGVDELAKLYREIDADYYVSLDYPPGANITWRERSYYIARTVNAFLRLRSMLRDYTEEGRLVPVVHMSTGLALRVQLGCYYDSARVLSVGGLIPYFMQRAGKGSRAKALLFLEIVRRLWDDRLHALGLASAAIIPLLRGIGVDSSDTQTWRHKAAYGKIIVPGLGERHVSGKKVQFGPAVLKPEEERHVEDLARRASLETGTTITLERLRRDFEARAVFNAYVLKTVAENHHPYGGLNKAFYNLYKSISTLRKMSIEELEEKLYRLLAETQTRSRTIKTRTAERGGEGGDEKYGLLGLLNTASDEEELIAVQEVLA